MKLCTRLSLVLLTPLLLLTLGAAPHWCWWCWNHEEVELDDAEVFIMNIDGDEGSPSATVPPQFLEPGTETLAMDLLISVGPLSSLAQILLGSEHFTANTGEFVLEGLQPGPHTIFAVGNSGDRDMVMQAVIDFRPGQAPIELIAQQCGSLSVTISRPDAHRFGTPTWTSAPTMEPRSSPGWSGWKMESPPTTRVASTWTTCCPEGTASPPGYAATWMPRVRRDPTRGEAGTAPGDLLTATPLLAWELLPCSEPSPSDRSASP